MKIYKLCYCDDMNAYEVFNHIELFTKKGLQRRLRQAIYEEQLNETTLEEYGLDENTDCETFTPEQIMQIFRDDGYECDEDWLEEGGLND